MSFAGLIGALLVFSGVFHLGTYLQRKRWPVVEGTFDSVDVNIEATVPSKGVGLFIHPKYIHKIRYSYGGSPYVVEFSENEIIVENRHLRVNPSNPREAFLDNKTWFFPILAISLGIILILVLLKIQVAGATTENE